MADDRHGTHEALEAGALARLHHGRYVVGPLILAVIVVGLLAAIVLLGTAIATGIQNMP